MVSISILSALSHTQVEQPAAIARALAYGGRLGEDRVFLGGLDRRREDMDNIKHLLLVLIAASRGAFTPSTRVVSGNDGDFEAVRTALTEMLRAGASAVRRRHK